MMRLLAAALVLCATPLFAQDATPTRAAGLDAWGRIHEVVSHPRCTNCHVGDSGQPMWNALGYGPDTVHGMGVMADETRIGALSVPCSTCHVTSDRPNVTAHAPGHIDDDWRLAPAELVWLGRESADICTRMRDPETNDGHDLDSLVDHTLTSEFVAYGFDPGAGRSAPDGSPEEMARDLQAWAAAGFPCP